MGTPDFAVEPLRCLVEGGYNVVGVITMPDKPIGRHQSELSQSPVKQYAVAHGLPVLQPEKLKDEGFIADLRALQADLQIVVAFRMLPEVVWQMPRFGTFNLHASLLPRYRGAAPINWAIINGDKETGITTFFLQHAIDTGNVIQQERIPILPTDNAETIHDQLMMLGGRLVVETVDNILADKVKPIPQEEMNLPVAEYQRQAPKIFKDTCRIDWNRPVRATFDFIRGLSPYPGAWSEFMIGGKTTVLKIFRSQAVSGAESAESAKSDAAHEAVTAHEVGQLFTADGQLYVQQPDGVQRLEEVQQAGKRRMAAADFLRGVRLAVLLLSCFILQALLPLESFAQRRSVAQMRQALTSVMTAERAQRLQPVAQLVEAATPATAHLSETQRTHTYSRLTVLSDSEAGFAVVSHTADAPAILAYGEQGIDSTSVSPEFVYLMDLYEAGADRSKAPRRVNYTNVNSLITTQWAQGAPFSDSCPFYESTGKRSPTGCVATSMAQVLNYHKLPKSMRGFKTYSYTNAAGHRVAQSFDFRATTFDWANMVNSYTNWLGSVTGTAAQKQAVSTLMYACGVAASMQYGEKSSAAFSYNAAQGITAAMEGVEAFLVPYDEQTIVDELVAGRPVIYGGYDKNLAGHSFVIDGVTSDGRYRCNLGWGGSGNGEYAATDMNGYAYMKDDLFLIQPSAERRECTPIPELQGLYASVRRTPVQQWREGRWYVLWNAASARSPYSAGSGREMQVRPIMPSGEAITTCADQLVRFVPKADGTYYLQTATGHYLGALTAYGKAVPRATEAPEAAYSIGTITPGYFWFNNSNCHMRIEDYVGQLEGWSPVVPTDPLGSSAWQLYEVALSETPITDPSQVPTLPEFDATKTYTLRNTGYSQGYLVALSAADAHPTLRGVTQDHSNGLFAGARYHDAADLESDGAYWYIETEGVRQYLRNVLTGKYLANQGDRTPYVFTATKTPIQISQQPDGTFSFNSGSQAESYLCAATHLENPAAFWTATDEGSAWTVEQRDMPSAYVPVSSIALEVERMSLFDGDRPRIAATVLPQNASHKQLEWRSSDTSVCTVDASGQVEAVGAGTAVVTVSSVSTPSVSASVEVNVASRTLLPTTPINFSNLTPYLLQNKVGTGAYLVAEEGNSAHPSIRAAVLTTHPDGYYSEQYEANVDYSSPYSYWQILTDKSGRYYLRNAGNGLYLAHSGDQTPYVFTATLTPINVGIRDASNFTFNTSNHFRSYLCVSTNTENPLAYWIVSSEYCSWMVYAVEGLDLGLTDPLAESTTGLSFAPRASIPTLDCDLAGRRIEGRASRSGIIITSDRKKVVL